MRFDSKSGLRGMFIDRDTNRPVRWIVWAEIPDDPEQMADYEAFRSNPEEWKARGFPLSEIRYKGRCRLRFIPSAPRYGVRPTSQKDLQGSLDEARKRLVEPKLLIPGEECEERGCHALSEYRVSWEQIIEPALDEAGNLCERAVMTQVHCYCSKHYRLPRMVSQRGVESEVEVEEGRPQ